MENKKLVNILTRITYRMEWEDWNLTDQEYDLLDSATGQEIAATAYNHGLPMFKLLLNADELVDQHNEREQRKILSILKELKMDLMLDVPRQKKDDVVKSSSEEIERRLVEETINEVAGFDPMFISENTEEIEKNPAASSSKMMNLNLNKAKPVPGPSFVSQIIESNASRADPSLMRDIEQGAGNITLAEHVTPSLQFLGPDEGFPEASEEEIADAGHFAASYSQSLFKKIREKDNAEKSLREPDIQEQFIPIDTPLREDLEAVPIPHLSDDRISLNMPELLIGQQHNIPLPEISSRLEHLSSPLPQDPSVLRTESCARTPSHHISRREIFEKTLLESPSRPKQKARRKPRRAPLIEEGDAPLELNKIRTIHKRKPKMAAAPRLTNLRLHINVDLFEDLDGYQADQEEPEDEEEIEEDQQQALQIGEAHFSDICQPDDIREKISIPPMLQQGNEDGSLAIAPLNITEETSISRPLMTTTSRSPKRRRLNDKENEFLQPIDLSHRFSEVPIEQTPETSLLQPLQNKPKDPATSATPGISFSPSIMSTIMQKSKQRTLRVPLEEMDYNQLCLISERRLQQPALAERLQSKEQTELNIVGDTSAQDVGVGAPEPHPEAPAKHGGPIFFRKVEHEGQTNIRFAVNGKIEQFTQFHLDTVGLYMQIRFIMKERDLWKLKYDDLRPMLSLIGETSDHIIKMRLWLLEDQGLVNLSWTDDGNDIKAIEIPVREKEN